MLSPHLRHLLLIGLAVSSAFCSLGCSNEGEVLPSVDTSRPGVGLSSSDSCEPGETRACGETIEYENGIMSCFRGTQSCAGDTYGPCEDGVVTREAAPPQGRAREGRELLSLSSPATCDDPMSPFFNPCDPGCRYFDEDPPDITGMPVIPPTPPVYTGNPATTFCAGDVCTASASPLDYGCNDCVTDVCDVDMSCCTTAWTQECANSALLICAGITVPDIPGLCGFGLYSDTTLTTANRPSANALIGAYGDVTIGTDANLEGGGIRAQGSITFNSLNNKDIDAALGIIADGNITSQDSDTTLTGDMYAGGTLNLPSWQLASGYTVASVGNVTGLNGTESFGALNTQGAISGVTLSGTSCSSMTSCYTHTPVELPPQTAGTAIPILTTDCSGTDGPFTANGTTVDISPGVHGDVDVINDGSVRLVGEGTYHFTSFRLDGGSLILEPDMGGAVGWDIRVCGDVSLHNGTIIEGGTGLTNDANDVLLDPSLLTFYAETSSTIYMGTDVYFSGIFMAPHGRVEKANVNSPPTLAQITSGTRAAPINGAVWANELDLGTGALTYQIPEEDCEDMGIPGTATLPGTFGGMCPIDNNLPGSPGALLDPCSSGADCQFNHRCVAPETDASCAHSKCETGAALGATCDPCVEAICAQDATCCSGSWTAVCVNMVDTVCDAVCDAAAADPATCTDNADGFTESCGGYDLALGIPCDDEIDVCNHGDTSFFGNVSVGFWADDDNQMAYETPLLSPEGTCDATNVSIAPGRCTTISCAVPAGTYTLMVDPEELLSECDGRRSDNWSVDDDRSCPLVSATTTRLEVEDYDGYSNPSALGGDAGRGGDDGFDTCGDVDGCGYYVGWTDVGDWVEWTYDAPINGVYSVDIRLASNTGFWSNQLLVDGVTVSTQSSGPSTGGWQTYADIQTAPFSLTAGTHTLRLLFNSPVQNVNYIEVHSPELDSGTVVQTYDYEATCPDGTVALWGLFAWDAHTPGTSSVTFDALTAPSSSDLASKMADPLAWSPLAVAQSDVPPNTESCGLSSSCLADITEELSLGNNQDQFLGLRVTVEPDGSIPVLHDWVVTYSCVYDQ